MKPGIIMGNLITAAGAFAFGADSSIHWSLFALALCGLALVIGSGCACNHYSDRHADKMMERTKKRPLVIGAISPVRALVFAAIMHKESYTSVAIGETVGKFKHLNGMPRVSRWGG